VVIGGSAGSMQVMLGILALLPGDYPLPLLAAHHLHKTDGGRFAQHLDSRARITVTEAVDKQAIEPAHLYVAPADYHLLVERGGTLALSIDPKVNWARPSIDVLFESAARVWADRLVGVLLSGANDDGARGLKVIRGLGGLCIAQDPGTAESATMPRSAIDLGAVEEVLQPEEIGRRLRDLDPRSAALHEVEDPPGSCHG
jgi:two-component system chemotaxis response regulator CheB